MPREYKRKIRHCERCGSELPYTRNRLRYCSATCRMRRTEVPCKYCGVVMSLQPHDAKKRIFCSKVCSDQWKGSINGVAHPHSKPLDKDILKALYIDQRLGSKEVGELLNCPACHVRHWLEVYGIERRASGCSMANRGTAKPSRDELYDLAHVQHLGTREIGKMYGCDKAAVRYWMIKYDIPRPTVWETRRANPEFRYPSKSELVQLYVREKYTATAIAGMYGCSETPIWRLLKKYGIPSRQAGFGQKYTALNGTVVKSSYELRVANWLIDNGTEFQYEPTLPFYKRSRADFFARGIYIEIWGMVGVRSYDAKMRRKKDQYEKHRARLVEFTAVDFDANNRWKDTLKEHFSSN